MKVLVCVKQIINRNGNNKEDDDQLNSNDLNAAELALEIKDQVKPCEVTIMSMGIMSAQKVIRNYLAMGGDNGILLSDKQYAGADTLATSETISKAITYNDGYDLIICGVHSSDGGTGQVGPEVAEKLGYSLITNVQEFIEVDEESIVCKRKLEEEFITEKVKLPAVITVLEGINEPRTKTIRSAMLAAKKTIQVLTNDELKIPADKCGLSGSETNVKKVETEEISARGEMVGLDDEKIKEIYEIVFGK